MFFFPGFSIAMRQLAFDLPTLFRTGYKGSNGEPEKKGIGEDGVVSHSVLLANRACTGAWCQAFAVHFLCATVQAN